MAGTKARATQQSVSERIDLGRIDVVRGRNDELAIGMDDLGESVEAMTIATQETSDSASQAHAATAHVAQASSAVSAAAEELEASMREVAATAASSLQVAMQAEETMGGLHERVSHLDESTGHISSVVDTVSRISSQTRMLALNATIEAARAGEAGRGFAVVAAEVKDLANQTSEATVEITQRLESLAGDSHAVSSAVETISEVLSRVEALQQTIAAAVEEQTAAIGELNRSAAESADAASALTESVNASATAATAAGEALARTRSWLDRVSVTVAAQRADFDIIGRDIPQHPLRAAVAAHAAWKDKLRGAIESGRVPSGTSPQAAARDDACDFGIWLNSGAGAALDPRRAAEAAPLHAAFHREAGAVLTEVARGRKEAAAELVNSPDHYAGAARDLTDLLLAWGASISE